MFILTNNYILKNINDLKLFISNMRTLIRRFLEDKNFVFSTNSSKFKIKVELQKNKISFVVQKNEKKFSLQTIRDICFAIFAFAYFCFVYIKTIKTTYSPECIKHVYQLQKNLGSYEHLKYSLLKTNVSTIKKMIKPRIKKGDL